MRPHQKAFQLVYPQLCHRQSTGRFSTGHLKYRGVVGRDSNLAPGHQVHELSGGHALLCSCAQPTPAQHTFTADDLARRRERSQTRG